MKIKIKLETLSALKKINWQSISSDEGHLVIQVIEKYGFSDDPEILIELDEKSGIMLKGILGKV